MAQFIHEEINEWNVNKSANSSLHLRAKRWRTTFSSFLYSPAGVRSNILHKPVLPTSYSRNLQLSIIFQFFPNHYIYKMNLIADTKVRFLLINNRYSSLALLNWRHNWTLPHCVRWPARLRAVQRYGYHTFYFYFTVLQGRIYLYILFRKSFCRGGSLHS